MPQHIKLKFQNDFLYLFIISTFYTMHLFKISFSLPHPFLILFQFLWQHDLQSHSLVILHWMWVIWFPNEVFFISFIFPCLTLIPESPVGFPLASSKFQAGYWYLWCLILILGVTTMPQSCLSHSVFHRFPQISRWQSWDLQGSMTRLWYIISALQKSLNLVRKCIVLLGIPQQQFSSTYSTFGFF